MTYLEAQNRGEPASDGLELAYGSLLAQHSSRTLQIHWRSVLVLGILVEELVFRDGDHVHWNPPAQDLGLCSAFGDEKVSEISSKYYFLHYIRVSYVGTVSPNDSPWLLIPFQPEIGCALFADEFTVLWIGGGAIGIVCIWLCWFVTFP